MVTRRKKRTSASGPRPRRLAPRNSRKLRRTDAEMKTVALVTRELDEARQQQAATADVLKVISQSGAELGPVLDTLVAAAARICLAESGFIFRLQEDGLCRVVASFGIPAAYKDFQARNPIAPGRGTLAGRTVLERRAVHIEDAAADPEYTRIEAVQLGNQRTMLGVPLARDNALIGVITLARSRVEAFSEKEIALVGTFADQAVIAIENARLLSELRQRTTDLSKALDQQTATSEVLQGISSSPGELEPVLQAILAHATRLCEASYGAMWLKEGDRFCNAAFHGTLPAAYIEQWRSSTVGRTAPLGRVAQSQKPLQIADLREDQTYLDGHPLTITAVHVAGIHTLAIVPMLKEDEFVGAIAKVISRSTFDLKSVLRTLVESAARLCEAEMAAIARQTGTKYHLVARHGYPSGYSEHIETLPIEPGRGSVTGRVLLEGKRVHIIDVVADLEYTLVEAQKRAGYRTMLGVPLLREGN